MGRWRDLNGNFHGNAQTLNGNAITLNGSARVGWGEVESLGYGVGLDTIIDVKIMN